MDGGRLERDSLVSAISALPVLNFGAISVLGAGYAASAGLDLVSPGMRLYVWFTYLCHFLSLGALGWMGLALLARWLPARIVLHGIAPLLYTAIVSRGRS